MIQETNRLETLSRSATKRMEYHTERIVTVKFHPTVILTVVLAGIAFVVSAYLSH